MGKNRQSLLFADNILDFVLQNVARIQWEKDVL